MPAARGASGERRGVHGPGHVGRQRQRIEGEDAAPGRSGPENTQDQAGRQERKSERQGAIRQPIERGQRRKRVIEGPGAALGSELTLLQEIHHRAGEVEHERRDAHERQPDVHPEPCAAQRRADQRAGRRRLQAEQEGHGQDERAQHRETVAPLDPHLEQDDDPDGDRHGLGHAGQRRAPEVDREGEESDGGQTQADRVASKANRCSSSSRWTR
jgi:hypothetical protein